jgi:anti-sigma B factor antagonist
MIECSEIGPTLVIELKDKTLDAQTAKDFRREVQQRLDSHTQVVFDLSGLTFVDSSGLGVLLSCLRQVSGRGGDLKLCSLTKQVRAVFQLVRMHRLFDIYNSQGEAVGAFQA